MFNSENRKSNYAQKSVFSLERVLVKAQILNSEATDPKFRTVLLRRTHQRTYIQDFGSLDVIPAKK
jgi:hypothetical protein